MSEPYCVARADKNGLITGVSPGTAIITFRATDGSGRMATHRVTVRPRPVPPVEEPEVLGASLPPGVLMLIEMFGFTLDAALAMWELFQMNDTGELSFINYVILMGYALVFLIMVLPNISSAFNSIFGPIIDAINALMRWSTPPAFVWPVPNNMHHTNSPFGHRGRTNPHRGIDINHNCGRGDTQRCGNECRVPIFAAAAGVVVFENETPSYGNVIVIRHNNGMYTLYAHNHMRALAGAQLGQHVTQGQQIAIMGNTGASEGSHLHFELRPRFNSLGDLFRVNPLAVYNRQDPRTAAGTFNPNPLFICTATTCRDRGGCIRGLNDQPGGALGGVRGGHNFVFNPNFNPAFFNGGINGTNSRWWNP